MPRRKNDPQPDPVSAGPAEGSDEQDTIETPAEDDPRSSETMVILPAADEPVRRGGHILTEDGWVPEDQPIPGDDMGPEEPDEQEQE